MTAILPAAVRTVGGMFDHAAARYPGKEVRSFFAGESITFDRLARNGRIVAGNLVAAGIEPGRPVAVLVRSNLEFLQVFGGVAASGATVVPLSVSVGLGKAHLARLAHVIEDCGARFAIVDDTLAEHVAELLPHLETLTLSSLMGGGEQGSLPAVDEEDLALIQYTSGSTANPRGVALTHRNVLAGIRALHHGIGRRPDDVLCHWLPLSHDMGLFSTLAALGAGVDIRISPPQDFVKHPDDWLRKFSEYGASVIAGPNFSYQYLLDAIPREETPDYDLSKVRVMLNGAEPIDPGLATAFARHFAASGIAPRAMTPCYGLAEATLAVALTPTDETASVDWVDRDVLNSANQAQPAEPGTPNARGVVNCGEPVLGIEVRIAQDGRALPERAVGDIEIRGEPVMRGYYREPETSISPDGWCSTGDLGYMVGSCLYVTGRQKEMLIFGGQNYYPQDIEDVIRQLPGIHKGHAVAVVLPADPAIGVPERIGVLAEVGVASQPYGETVSAIRGAAAGELGGASVDVVLMRRNGLLRTTSGKFQRLLMRRQLLEGTLGRVLVHVGAGEPVPMDRPVGERSAPSLA